MKRALVWVLAGTLMLAPGNGLLLAQSADPGSGQQLDVYLRNLEAKKSEFEELVSEKLNPQRSEIRESFKKTIADLDDHLVALRQNPQDDKRKAAYEETLSLAITQAMGFLGDYKNLEGKTMGRIDQMQKALDEARQACVDQEKTSLKEVDAYRQRTVSIESQLQALAQKYAEVIQKDGVLPPDVELDVRLLEADLGVAQQTAAFAEIAQQDMQLTAEDLKYQLADLTELKGSLQVSFRKASGQQMLLGRVSEIKERRLAAMQMRTRILAFSKVIPDLKKDLANVDGLISRFLNHDQPKASGNPANTVRTVSSRQGLTILKSYLKPAPNDSEKSDEASVVHTN